jgi:DNA-binding response OmpR family regulator
VGAFEKLAIGGSIVLNGNSLGPQTLVRVKSETLETIQAGTFCSDIQPRELIADRSQISNKSSQSSRQLLQHQEEVQSKQKFADSCMGKSYTEKSNS